MIDSSSPLSIKNLSIGYSKPLYEKVNLIADKGDLIGVIGKNGSGKSTLLRTLTGMMPLLAGSILLASEEPGKLSKKKMAQKVSVLFSGNIENINLTGFEVIALGRYPHTSWWGNLNDDDLEIIENAIKVVEIPHLRDKKIFRISDGEKQKVLLARALVQDTPLIVMDEPTTYLDYSAKKEAFMLFKRLCEQHGKTIIMATHEIELVRKYMNKVWDTIPEKGIIEGKTLEVLNNSEF